MSRCSRCDEQTDNRSDSDDYVLCDDCADEFDAALAKDD